MCTGESESAAGANENTGNEGVFAEPAEARGIAEEYVANFDFEMQEMTDDSGLEEHQLAQARLDAANLVAGLSDNELENGELQNYIDGIKESSNYINGEARATEMVDVLNEIYDEIYR